jgi:hemolysin activation/secretion protein
VVEVAEKRIDASARVDNRGTKSRGPYEYLGSVTANNILGWHDALTLTAAGAFPLRTLQYFDAAYRQVLTSEGLAFFADASYGFGKPGTPQLEILDYRTKSTYVQGGLLYPFIRSRERNLTLSALGFLSNNESDTLGATLNEDRLRGVRLKVDADIADSLGGINQGNVTLSQGFKGFGSTVNGNLLASRAAGRVDFGKAEATLSRTQPLFGNFSVYLSVYGQLASTALLSPEQCGYGGRFFGRAFDPSALLGDQCIEALGELRYDLPFVQPWLTQAQVYTFSDYGKVYNKAPAFGTPASANGASIGAGARLGWANRVDADLQAAKGVDGPRRDWRFFFTLAAHY